MARNVVLYLAFSLASVLAAQAPAGAGSSASKASSKVVLVGDGVLDLRKVDTNSPINITLNVSPGHFTRVLLPKGFEHEFQQVCTDSGIQVRSSKRFPDGRRGRDIFASSAAAGLFRATIVYQNKKGKAVVLVCKLVGQAGSLEDSKAVQDLLEANGGYFPENAGPALQAGK